MNQHFLIDGTQLVIGSLLVLGLGKSLNQHFGVLSRYNIPMSVTGGLLCAVVLTCLYSFMGIVVDFDLALRDLLLLVFFSTVGLSAKLSALAAGGRTLLVLLGFAILLLVLQDLVGIGIALLLDRHPAYGLFAGSISFAGGHGTAIAWGHAAEQAGLERAATMGIACATFGLVAGGLLGGPLASYLVNKHKLREPLVHHARYKLAAEDDPVDESGEPIALEAAFSTLLMLALCVGVGEYVNDWLQGVGIALPEFLTAMTVGIVITNLVDYTPLHFHPPTINRAGEVSLHLFLAMSLMSVQLWLIADAAGPLLVILMCQMLVISTLAVFLVFRFTGGDYDAAVIAGGFLGLGLGATPVAMANMQAMTSRYGPSTRAFIVVPLVGAFFLDLSNAMIINGFLALPGLAEGLDFASK